MRWIPLLLGAVAVTAAAQTPCANTPAYSPCEMVFELGDADAAKHPQPYTSVEIRAEFRSPRHRTFLLPAYWDGGKKMVIRFTPTEAGEWVYRLTSNLTQYEGKQGTFTAAASEAPGFIRPANMHHWAYTEGNKPHFWLGAAELRFAFMDDAQFRAMADSRAAQGVNHISGVVLGGAGDKVFGGPEAPDLAFFQRLDERIRYLNSKGIVADLILAGPSDHLVKVFPDWQQRRRFVRYVIGRYAAMNVTWLGVQDFETYSDPRVLLKEIGGLLKEMDPYQHPRSTSAQVTSAPLLEDGWMSFAVYGSGNDQVGAIEHQLYPVPDVALNCGAAASADEFRRRLWNTAMNGQYIGCAPEGAEAAKTVKIFNEFFADTRHWELEPFFDIDGGRGLTLEEIDYVVYVEKPAGPVEVLVERHGYDVTWFNPITGESTKAKNYKGEHYTGEAPDRSHDWILRLAREGRIESMNKSYKFESREIVLQEIEVNSQKVPFEIEQPAGDISLTHPAAYAAKIKRETRATRQMMWLWTGESAADNQGYRVLATGQSGTFQAPKGIAKRYPAVLHLRLLGMNANGKVYALDRTASLNP